MGEEFQIAEYVLTEDVSRDAAVLRLGGEALYLLRGHPFWSLVDLLFEVRAPIRLRVQMGWVERLKAHPQAELRQASSEMGQSACCLADFAAFTPILGDQITLTDRGGRMESVLIGLPATTLIDVLTLPRVRVPFFEPLKD